MAWQPSSGSEEPLGFLANGDAVWPGPSYMIRVHGDPEHMVDCDIVDLIHGHYNVLCWSEESLGLDLGELRRQNVARLARWHGSNDGWTLADWSNAMCGEAGEAANVVKKIRRTDSELWDKQKYPGDGASAHAKLADMPAAEARAVLTENLANELADIVCYADLLAHHAGIDLGAAIEAKFNRVSEAQGFPERIGEAAKGGA